MNNAAKNIFIGENGKKQQNRVKIHGFLDKQDKHILYRINENMILRKAKRKKC